MTIKKIILKGIYDPEGINNNPLTGKPYENLYKHIKKTINGIELPATYANLANIWKTKLVYVHKDQILNSIINNQVTLAKAGTGVGKTCTSITIAEQYSELFKKLNKKIIILLNPSIKDNFKKKYF